jgi:inosose dehydratase
LEPFEDPLQRVGVLEVVRATCELISGAGGTHVVLIQAVSDARAATAGDDAAAQRLGFARWERLIDGLRSAARIARADYALRPVLHNHAGTALEFADELHDALMAVPPEEAGLCLDTGHAAYAGIDLDALLDRWGERVEYLHLKDVREEVRDGAVRGRAGFWGAVGEGVFCPLGEGMVDFPRLLARLERMDFDGPVTIEQDRRPGAGTTPEESVRASVDYLNSLEVGHGR